MANSNKWFKHYNNASDGGSLEVLWAEQDYETIAFFWRMNEWVSKFESETERGTCQLSLSFLKRKLGWNRSRSVRVLSKIGSRFQMKCELQSDDETIKVFTPNWLELQENRGGKTRAKTEQNADRGKKREEEERGERKSAVENNLPPSPLFELWNEHRGSLSLAKEFTKDRKKKAEARWRECPARETWIEVISSLAASPFCNGENDRDWKASFDFLLQPETRTKVLEGRYSAPAKKTQPRGAQVFIP